MRLDKFDLNLLNALNALLTERSVSGAAWRTHVSQSTMSGILKRLRDYFEDDLLVVAGRYMVLTPRAEELAEPVRETLHLIKSRITTPPRFDPATSNRRVTIQSSEYSTSVVLAPALQAFSRLAPELSFEILKVDITSNSRLEQGEVDLFLSLAHHASPLHPMRRLFEDDFVGMVAITNSSVGESMSSEQFFAAQHVGVQIARGAHPFAEQWLQATFGSQRRIAVFTPTYTDMPKFIAETSRIGVVPRRLAMQMTEHLPIRIVSLPIEIPAVRHIVQWHKSDAADAGILWLVEQISAVAGDSADASSL